MSSSAAMALTAMDTQSFRDVMGRFATGVAVLTVRADDGFHGVTVSSFTSVSLQPTLISVCLQRTSRGSALLPVGRAFTVNVLSVGQESASRRFADPRRRPGFDGLVFRLSGNGCPLLVDSAAHLECEVTQRYPGGDHTIVVGQVSAISSQDGQDPLIFHRGRYRELSPEFVPSAATAVSEPALRVVPPLPS